MLYQIVGLTNMLPQKLCPTIAKTTTFIITYLNTVLWRAAHVLSLQTVPYYCNGLIKVINVPPTIPTMPFELRNYVDCVLAGLVVSAGKLWLVVGIWRSEASFHTATADLRIENFFSLVNFPTQWSMVHKIIIQT